MHFDFDETDPHLLIATATDDINTPGDREDAFLSDIDRHVNSGVRGVILDCGGIHYISTVGIGVLMKLHKRLTEHGGRLKLVNLSNMVRDEIATLRLDRMLEICKDMTSARSAFSAG